MANENVFADEWRSCLREHYKHVVRNDPNPRNFDSVNKAFLRPNGERPPIFTESELQQLYIEATMRTDEMPEDFVPNLDVLEAAVEEIELSAATDEPSFQPHPLECQCPACIEINLKPHDGEGQPLTPEAVAELEEEVSSKKRRKKEDLPKQLTLF